jgi:hypothetical protein
VFLGLNRYRIVAATDRRILVLDAGQVSMKKARGLLAELPRPTRLGPTEGVWHVIDANGEKLRAHRRFFRDIEHADASATESGTAGRPASCLAGPGCPGTGVPVMRWSR